MKISAEVPHTSVNSLLRCAAVEPYDAILIIHAPSLAALYKCLRFVVYNWFIQCFSFLLTNFGSRGVLRFQVTRMV